jgi:hypothetical protein
LVGYYAAKRAGEGAHVLWASFYEAEDKEAYVEGAGA